MICFFLSMLHSVDFHFTLWKDEKKVYKSSMLLSFILFTQMFSNLIFALILLAYFKLCLMMQCFKGSLRNLSKKTKPVSF